jgi:hypothetical protein
VEWTLDVFLYHDNGMRECVNAITQGTIRHSVTERRRRHINANDNVTIVCGYVILIYIS